MLIGELSRRTGVGAHQLRYYEEQGLLAPERAANGYREYPEGTVAKVGQIRRLLSSGLSTKGIVSMMPCVIGDDSEFESCPELLTLMHSRDEKLTSQIDALNTARETLRGFIEGAGDTAAAGRPWA